ncbi:MAG: right-handed parallel beta-helix repeat-containing protein [Phycisphaerae bacterium]|nr:right-handed parallel beta-helix repeat-containing protein [Phycisphaerae bacterium]
MTSRYTLSAIVALILTSMITIDNSQAAIPSASLEGLAGHWDFDDGTGQDLSGHGHHADLGGTDLYSLGTGHSCLMFMPDDEPMRISASSESSLAIARGTVSLWLNMAWDGDDILKYSNGAVQFKIYRGHFQPRFKGEETFKYSSGILDFDWPKYDMREWAFYGHPKAAVGDSEWHLFAVAYDDQAKRIIGWRDGERISVVDLSTVAMEPLARQGLKEIVVGEGLVGFVDDIRIYDQVLTDEAMRELYNSTRSIYAGRQDTNPTDKEMDVYRYRQEDDTLYRAWLQYRPLSRRPGEELFKSIVAEGPNSTVKTAASELTDAVESLFAFEPSQEAAPLSGPKTVLGTAETSSWIRRHAEALGLDRIKDDGFIIKAVDDGPHRTLVIAGRVPAGVIFGTFDLIRRLQLGQDPGKLDVLETPQIPIRMVDHWAYFRGFPGDKWRGGGRDCSIYSWQALRTGDTRLIRDWVRMMASVGWNAICPSEVNWDYRNNFLEHLDEVEILAGILRDYGMRLYWSPSYLLALEQGTADQLYARVPDFGGYLMKLGSEKQNGDPRPPMVNRIADTLKPYGGLTLVRGFVYGNSRYTREPYRNLIPHDLFAQEDGNFRDNVIILPKGSPLDWDFSAPLPALDGAMQKTLSGTELVIDKGFPSSWIEKWQWWMEQDHYHKGPGSLNKFDVDCIVGVSMIEPGPAWTTSPLNMVNYYGLGRLAWNPDRTVEEIYTEWIMQTFGSDPDVIDTVKTILYLSDDVARKLYMYRGYRGIWLDKGDQEDLVQDKTTHVINRQGLGPANALLAKRTLAQYSPGLRDVYGDRLRGEEFLTSFHFVPHDTRLSMGRTVIQDFYENMNEAVTLAAQLPPMWKRIEEKIDVPRFTGTLKALEDFVKDAEKERNEMWKAFGKVTGTDGDDVTAALTRENLARVKVYNVRHYGAKADGSTNDAPAINQTIEACHAAGGGTVFVPSGMYGTGSIRLKSNITLALDKGAVLKALPGLMDPWEPNPNDKGLMDSAYYHWEASLIRGINLENIKIFGPGTLDGSALTRSSRVPNGTGDKGIALKLCRNVEIRNLNIHEGGHYAILATGCKDMLVDNVAIKTSRDGLNLSQCSNVVVTYCHIDAVRREDGQPAGGDDAIKLGSDLSLGQALPCENITVKNCFLASGCNTLQFGSETVGTFKNVRFENIRILGAGKAGISITSNDGSIIDGVHYQDITMAQTFAPIFIKLSDVARVPEGSYKRGAIRNITFENITATDCYAYFKNREMPSVIWGKPGSPIQEVSFKNVRITARGGHSAVEASLDPKDNDEHFPRKVGDLPAYAWYLRHVENIRFLDCHFDFEQTDGRSPVVVDDGKQVIFENGDLKKGSGPDTRIVWRKPGP